MDKNQNFISYSGLQFSEEQTKLKSEEFFGFMNQRRSLREFSDKPVYKEVIENVIKTASTAPSGAHKQPWTFCAISNPEIKSKIREAAEKEEYQNYHGRMSDDWLKDLEKFDTNHIKPFLEIAPWIIVVFKQTYGLKDGEKELHYYVNESVGLACGMLLTAIHNAGLVALTHTPSPLNFLTNILNRPSNEKPFLLIPVGYPSKDAKVPNLDRKELKDIAVWFT